MKTGLRNFWRVAGASTLLLLGACGHLAKPAVERPWAWLEPGVRVTLPAPGITPPIHSQQLLTGSFNGQPQSLLVLLDADAKKIKLAGLSSLGVRLFLLSYDGWQLHTEQSILTAKLPPASQVLADVMLSHWPLTAWQAQLPSGWTLVDQGSKRELRNAHGQLVSTISYQKQHGKRLPVALVQHAFHYQISIQYLDE